MKSLSTIGKRLGVLIALLASIWVLGALSFDELKQRSHINPAARAASNDPGFSGRIRSGNPGMRTP